MAAPALTAPRTGWSRRRHLVVRAAILLLVLAICMFFVQRALAPGQQGAAEAAASPSAASEGLVAPVTAVGLAPMSVPSVRAVLGPGDAILTSIVGALQVFDSPGGAVTRELPAYTRYALPLTLMAVDDAEIAGVRWYQVSLPAKPNGQTGWVRASDVVVTSTNTAVHVYLAEHELDVMVDGAVALTAPVAVGDPATPTPLGTFYITDPIDLSSDPGGTYGAYALGISAYSETLDSFKGTLPQIAIHGTNQPASIGKSVSNGCVRMNNDTVAAVAQYVGLGTPVIIHASRADA